MERGADPRGETDVAEQASLFRALFEQTLDSILIADDRRVYVDANPAACRMLGLDRDAIVGKRLDDFADAPAGDLEAAWADFLSRGTMTGEFRLSTPDGRVVECEFSATANVLPGRHLSILRDVAERRRLEELLRHEARTIETIHRISSGIAASLDLDRIVQTITDETTAATGAQFGAFFYNVENESGESYMLYSLSGVDRSAFAGFPMPRNTAVFAPTFRGDPVVRLDDVTTDPRYGRSAPYFGMPEGHLPVRSYLAVPVVSRSGEVHGGLFFGHSEVGVFDADVERVVSAIAAQTAVAMDNARLFEATRRAREAADRARLASEEASRAKDEFLAVVSHELRTPLNAMLGWTRMLRTGELDDATSARALEIVDRNTRLQVQLIDDLLDVSSVISGKFRLSLGDVDLPRVVEAALDAARPAATAKAIRLGIAVDPGASTVVGDAERLQQVVWNLLSNAIKFTPNGGLVDVSLRRAGDAVEIAVADSGVGIPDEFLPHAFERFSQAESGTTRAYGGLGLGLAIVRSIAELHGGSVRAESDGPGLGSTFTVTLPARGEHDLAADDPARAGAASLDAASEPVALDAVRVLLIEDEPDTRDVLALALAQRGAHVEAVASAVAAFDALRDRPFDVLVSDIGMPDEDGYRLIARVRALGPDAGGAVPAIALTAYAGADDRQRALDSGFDLHVAKPIGPHEFAVAVAEAARITRPPSPDAG
jgi:PAS domain S-box-containing protein